MVNDTANTVTVHLAGAPQTVIDQLHAANPSTYIIDNTAAYSFAYLNSLLDKVDNDPTAFSTEGISLDQIGPTPDGYLKAEVSPEASPSDPTHSDLVTAAESILNTLYGAGPFEVVEDNSPRPTLLSYRYSDGTPWSGGDFIYHKTSPSQWSDCTDSFPVEDSAGNQYMLSDSHCWVDRWGYSGSIGLPVYNGYVRNDTNDVYSGSSQAEIGTVNKLNQIGSSTYTDDSSLILTGSYFATRYEFGGAWNGSTSYALGSLAVNHIGDAVCVDGAFSGLICSTNIQITELDQSVEIPDPYAPGGEDAVHHLNLAINAGEEPIVGQGDSGGAVESFTGTIYQQVAQPRGSIIAGSRYTPCVGNPPGVTRTCTWDVYFVGMSWLLNDWGVSLSYGS